MGLMELFESIFNEQTGYGVLFVYQPDEIICHLVHSETELSLMSGNGVDTESALFDMVTSLMIAGIDHQRQLVLPPSVIEAEASKKVIGEVEG